MTTLIRMVDQIRNSLLVAAIVLFTSYANGTYSYIVASNLPVSADSDAIQQCQSS